MYGVPKDLPLQRFVGDSICQIALGMHDVHFHFNKAGSINVDFGRWQIHDASGTIVDESIEGLPSTRQHYRVHVIFDSDVTKFDIDAPRSLTLTFANGHRLTVYDDSEQYAECVNNIETFRVAVAVCIPSRKSLAQPKDK